MQIHNIHNALKNHKHICIKNFPFQISVMLLQQFPTKGILSRENFRIACGNWDHKLANTNRWNNDLIADSAEIISTTV